MSERQAETAGLIRAHNILANFALSRPAPRFWGRRRATRDMQLLNELSDVLFMEVTRRHNERFDSILSQPQEEKVK